MLETADKFICFQQNPYNILTTLRISQTMMRKDGRCIVAAKSRKQSKASLRRFIQEIRQWQKRQN